MTCFNSSQCKLKIDRSSIHFFALQSFKGKKFASDKDPRVILFNSIKLAKVFSFSSSRESILLIIEALNCPKQLAVKINLQLPNVINQKFDGQIIHFTRKIKL